MSRFLDQLVAFMDFKMPWVLPSLEAVDRLFPFSLRLFVAAVLAIWLIWSKQRNRYELAYVRVRPDQAGSRRLRS